MSKLIGINTFLPNKGIVLNSPEEFLKNNYSSGDSRNMEFFEQFLQGRLGLTKFSNTMLSGPVLLIDQFWKFNGTWHLMICTTKDIYSYDFTNLRFDILTPVYTTGTITIAAGTPTIVTGAGGANFTTAAIKAGDFIKIGSGSVHTGSTWYQVLTKDSDTQLTLTTSAATCAGSAYVIRKIFNGASTNFWDSVTYQDAILGDVWVATNGIDTPIRYTGTGQVQALTGLPAGFTTCRYVDEFKDRLILAWTVEGANQPQRVRASAVANCESYAALDFWDLMEGGFWITGTTRFDNYLIIMRERDAEIGRWVGGDSIFDFEPASSCMGAWASQSIVEAGDYIYYYGPDNKFHRWNLLRDEVISEEIFPWTKDFDPNLEQYVFGWMMEGKNQIRWFVPHSSSTYNNACIVYDFAENVLHIWEYENTQACCSMGEYIRNSDLYADDVIWGEYYADTTTGFADDRTLLDGAPIPVYGGYDGYIRIADSGYNDDTGEYTRVFESVRQNFKLPTEIKRLKQQQHWLNSELAGNITLKLKKDDSNSWETDTKTISLIDGARDIIKKNITWNKAAQNFKLRIEASNHFAMLGYISSVFSKGKTIR